MPFLLRPVQGAFQQTSILDARQPAMTADCFYNGPVKELRPNQRLANSRSAGS